MQWIRRLAKGLWVSLLALALLFTGGDSFGAGNAIVQIAAPHLFSTASWEIGNFPKKWLRALGYLFRSSKSQEEEVAGVRRYFEIAEGINGMQDSLEQAAGVAAGASRPSLEAQLAALHRERDRLRPSVESALESMISEVLRKEGINSRVLFAKALWPPVDFALGRAPGVLVISPRDRIELLQAHLLDPDISLDEMRELERTIDRRNLSSLVEGTGGVATYPSLVPDSSSLRSALETASHEWVHQYLFFHPLGRAYWASSEMTTVNETVADLVGQEISEKVYRRYFASAQELAAPPRQPPTPSAGSRPAFDLNKELRETRLTAEGLLAEGKIVEAEAYMEHRRLFLAEHGYLFRKINQAFFAFHGAYAERPGAVSPVGGYLRTLRQESQSLKDFLSRVARYSSYKAFQRDLGIQGGKG